MKRNLLCYLMLLPLLIHRSYAAHWIFNNPYPEGDSYKKIYYSSFTEQPKTLDPALAYSANEHQFLAQIYEPFLQYDYYLRPYQLIPLTAVSLPQVRYLDKQLQILPPNSKNIAYSIYTITLKPGILFQPHPAFAKDAQGNYRYLNLPPPYLDDHGISQLTDFPYAGTRELNVEDYLYQIKRLANPALNSPIYGLISEIIVGFREFAQTLPKHSKEFIDLRRYPLKGIRKMNENTVEIMIYGVDPQFLYWLAMPFFGPVPWEVDKFYSQAGMKEKNLSFGWYPVGTGPFMLSENNPNKRMRLTKNPYYREVFFPTNGSLEDKEKGYMDRAGAKIPLLEEAVYTLEKESIPRWNKFLQGYYDLSGISNDSYDQAIQINAFGKPMLTTTMRTKNMRLTQTIDPSVYYYGFNMLDPIVGGNSERARKLRLAISIALNFEENIAIFLNGRGHPAQGPIPPGIFGYKKGEVGINPYIYYWEDNKAKRRPLSEAQALMREAGYPNGIDPQTKKALIIHYDVPVTSGPDEKSQLEWMRKQFAKLGIDLDIRATQYNRFQEKMRSGNAQFFSWGWSADYPDPENFLFMLYGPNGKVNYGGENATNYQNPRYDRLFELMKNRENDTIRQEQIDAMLAIIRHDAPWVWGINTETLMISQSWVSLPKPSQINLNQLKYMAINVKSRNHLRHQWNRPIIWPIGLLGLFIFLSLFPLFIAYWRNEKSTARRFKP